MKGEDNLLSQCQHSYSLVNDEQAEWGLGIINFKLWIVIENTTITIQKEKTWEVDCWNIQTNLSANSGSCVWWKPWVPDHYPIMLYCNRLTSMVYIRLYDIDWVNYYEFKIRNV